MSFFKHLFRATVEFWCRAIRKIDKGTQRALLIALGVGVGFAGVISLLAAITLAVSIATLKAATFHEDFTWNTFGNSFAISMLSYVCGGMSICIGWYATQDIVAMWRQVWEDTGPRGIARRLFQ